MQKTDRGGEKSQICNEGDLRDTKPLVAFAFPQNNFDLSQQEFISQSQKRKD